MTVGIVGVGTIAEALVHGLCGFDDRRVDVLLSPRNEAVTKRLAARYPWVKVAASNQAVVDGADIVLLAVRPQVAEDVLRALRFRAEQFILSVIATFGVERLSSLVAPASRVSRAIPLPPVAERQGPLGLYTQSREVAQLLEGLGRVIRVDDEAQLELISAATSLMGTYFGMAGAVDQWLVKRGFPPEESNVFVAELFLNLARVARLREDESFSELSREYSTPGGLNEQAWRELRDVGWADDVQAALDLVFDRIHGHATFETKLTR